MQALFLTSDLMVSSQAANAAKSVGCELTVVSSAEQLLEQMNEAPRQLVVVDLETSGGDMESLVSAIKSVSVATRVLAFGPHVWTEKLAAATAAGCDVVCSRGQFTREMKEIFAR